MAQAMSRLDVESYAQCVLAAYHGGRFITGHGQGASDAAMGRVFAYGRSRFADKADYALGYAFARFMLFAGLPKWRPPVTQASAADWFARFKLSSEGKG